MLTDYHTQKLISYGSCIGFSKCYQLYHFIKMIYANHHYYMPIILQQFGYKINMDLLIWIFWYQQWRIQSSYLKGVRFESFTCIIFSTILTDAVGYTWSVKLLCDHILGIKLTKMAMGIIIFSSHYFGKTSQYIEFTFVCQKVTKVIYQHIVVSILTMHMMPVPPQQRIVLLIELNLIKQAGCSSVHS